MCKLKKSFIIYLIIVIIPALAGSFYHIHQLLDEDFQKRKNHSKWVASIHQKSWDQLITQTVTSLDIISILVENSQQYPENLTALLRQTQQRDPRYGGLYLLDRTGKVITGSNDFLSNVDLSERDYINTAILTQDTIISDHPEILGNGQKVIGLAMPVFTDKKEIHSILVAYLRIDYIQNIMKVLTPDTKLYIVNDDDKTIININTAAASSMKTQQWVVVPLELLPWSIKAEIREFQLSSILPKMIEFLIGILILFHVLFLLVKYILLKRQAAKEKAQNEAQKLELVGTLAAGTAHEIRNPLTGIKGLIQLLSEKYKDEKDQYYFSVINKEIKRINEIVSEFLILGKPTAQILEVLDLRNIFIELNPIILSEANLYNVRYYCLLPPEPVLVKCTKDQIKQVVLNLTKNAFESMPDGGILKIELKIENRSCMIEVTDTGIGIAEEELSKIFDPFYTSKDTGTGLGLVICKRIVESFGGTIQILSNKQQGTKAVITLPLDI
ncbi:two-component sensor histidine kinase [Bacillus methanolicus]|uniref:PAS domain-containing sensor histidine kinase n=1 Tax=Bacillus methanolicus TaxID=1471 RepID=UPI002380809D|nr:PAS domain-containing sensor histidine kinase [Bacillus methanolicus]MDE3838318.1 two-component sensor histidine kinase [Bacillus methanolicus]